MTNRTLARFAGFSVGAAMLVGFAGSAGAVTIAELQAQIAALMAQLQTLQGGTASAAITSDLTVGSTGSQVVALQNTLVAGGYLTMPAGVAPGYFGSLTKAAVMAWQAANGVPSTGFVGPLSRAKLAGAVVATPGTTPVVSGSITTPGAEGTLTVSIAAVSNSTVYEGASMATILAFKAEADLSDIAIQRVKVDLTTDSDLYRNVLSKIYLVDDAGRTLASAELNTSTVVKNAGLEYEITLTGFSSVVAKDTSRTYTIKADVDPSIEAADLSAYTIALSEQGVRGVDGAGIDLYSANDESVAKAITFSASLAESATLAISNNTANPLAREMVAFGGSAEDEADKVVLMVFDIKAEKDNILITDMIDFAVTVVGNTAGATASTTYLYVGNGTSGQLLGSDTGTGTTDVADFTDIDYTIPAGTTKTFTLAADVRNANTVQTTVDASWTPTSTTLVAENTEGDAVATASMSGSATANDLLVRNVGPVFSIVGTPTIVRTTAAISTNSTTTATATFQLNVAAKGANVLLGTLASGTPMVANVTAAGNPSFVIYQNGSSYGTRVYASSTDYSAPSGYTVASETFTVQEGNNVTIPVTFWFQGKLFSTGADIAAASYATALERVNWVSTNGLAASTFMAAKTEWRTSAVSLP